MALINVAIPEQNFELVGRQIGIVLKTELDNQFDITADEDLEGINVFSERRVPFDKEDVPAVNITLFEGDYDNQNTVARDGHYDFLIDVYHKSKATDDVDGDTASALKLHRLMGVIAFILEDPQYRTLGIPAPSIASTKVSKIRIEQPDTRDESTHLIMGRIVFNVRVCEGTILIDPIPLGSYKTEVCLNGSAKGYIFSEKLP